MERSGKKLDVSQKSQRKKILIDWFFYDDLVSLLAYLSTKQYRSKKLSEYKKLGNYIESLSEVIQMIEPPKRDDGT